MTTQLETPTTHKLSHTLSHKWRKSEIVLFQQMVLLDRNREWQLYFNKERRKRVTGEERNDKESDRCDEGDMEDSGEDDQSVFQHGHEMR